MFHFFPENMQSSWITLKMLKDNIEMDIKETAFTTTSNKSNLFTI